MARPRGFDETTVPRRAIGEPGAANPVVIAVTGTDPAAALRAAAGSHI